MSSLVTGAEDFALIPSALIPIDTDLLAKVCAAAAASPRLRSNHNLHCLGDLVQRFLNALQPGTYVRPPAIYARIRRQALNLCWYCRGPWACCC